MRRIPTIALSLLACSFAFAATVHAATDITPKGRRSALTSIGAVQDLDAPPEADDPRAGSGFDAEGYFQNIVVGKVATCTSNVLKEFASWTKAQSLTISKTSQTAASVLALVSLNSPPGVLELDYRFNQSSKRARATLFFFSPNGSKHEPAALEALLKQYKVAALQDSLRVAIACQ